MGNCWKGISDREYLRLEKQLLELSGIPWSEFSLSNVEIDEQGTYIRTIAVGNRENQPMVMVHGYGGSGVMFWKILKRLSQKYYLLLPDIIGMGGSSRVNFPYKQDSQVDAANEFLIQWLEAWRIRQNSLTGFVLAGHSFGGYVCGMYACYYPQHVKKLLMLSPLGVPRIPKEFNVDKAVGNSKTLKKPNRCMIGIAKCVYRCRCSPFGIMRCCCRCCTSGMLNNFANRRFSSLPQDERGLYKKYLRQTLLMDGSTEYAIFTCFNMYMFAKHALVEDDRLGSIKIPVSFFYGEFDWMTKDSCQPIIDKNPYKGVQSHVYVVSNSDHHMYFDNSEEFTDLILQDLEKLNEVLAMEEPVGKSQIQLKDEFVAREEHEV